MRRKPRPKSGNSKVSDAPRDTDPQPGNDVSWSPSVDAGAGMGLSARIADLRVVEVATKQELCDLVTHLFDVRSQPVIGLTLMEGTPLTLLPPRGVRALIHSDPRIYIIRNASLLRTLNSRLGASLALRACCARIWWPGLTSTSDPLDHPLIAQLAGERADSLLDELAQRRWHFLERDPATRQVRLAL
jgi:hypothetical protein